MRMPFTADAFLEVFTRYNEAVWPLQALLYVLALWVIGLARRGSGRGVLSSLAVLWAWMGLVYHWGFFTEINRAAWAFGALFLVQAALLSREGLQSVRPAFAIRADPFGIAGGILVLYALVAYPLLGATLGRVYPESPTFGLPCPTTIFTFGVFLWSDARLPVRIVLVPALWSVIGFFAAASLSIVEDYGLLAAGLLATLLMAWKAHRASPAGPSPGWGPIPR